MVEPCCVQLRFSYHFLPAPYRTPTHCTVARSQMWEHDMTKWNADALCVLSEDDHYVHAAGVRQWVEERGSGAQVVVVPGWRHGSCVLGGEDHGVWSRILAHVQCQVDAAAAGLGDVNGGGGGGGATATVAPVGGSLLSTGGALQRQQIVRRRSSTLGGLTKRVVSFVDGLNTS
jgi:hypothetical protein